MGSSQYPTKTDLEDRKSSGDRARLLATVSREGPPARRVLAGQVLRLAKRLGVDPDVLARRYPPDTVRRLKYPVLEAVNADGTRTFKHDPGIEEALRSTLTF